VLAVITGASSGIGAAFARQLAARGWNLLLIARREDRLRAVARDLAAQYRISAEAIPADLTDPSSLAAVAAHIRHAPGLGLLVNNAGFGTQGYFHEAEADGQLRMHRLHVDATVALTHAAISNLTANLAVRAGPVTGVINVSSVAAFGRSPQNASYCATKAWMNSFTEGIALDLAARGVPVIMQALCPGFTLTEFHDVTGQDRSAIPRWLWLTPDFVVAESLRAFDLGKLIVVPGWRYKLGLGLLGLFPARIRRYASVAAVRRYRRQKQNPLPKENGSK
jgi:short-subunit dehydrogenase